MNILTTFAIATTFYDKEQNYFDSYFPFILLQFDGHNTKSVDEISDGLKKNNLNIPVHSIKTIISEKDKIFSSSKQQKDWSISLTKEGNETLSNLLATQRNLDFQLKEFYSRVNKYLFRNHEISFANIELKEKINQFLNNHLIEISVNGNQTKNITFETLSSDFEIYFSSFLKSIKDNDAKLCETFDLLWKGTVIWHELTKEKLPKKELKFQNPLNIYLDTNIILSILGFHNPIINKASIELLKLIRTDNNLKLFVTNDTLDEIHDLFDSYLIYGGDYYEIEIDTVFYYLKERGYTSSKIELLKDNLENQLKTLSINITNINKDNKYYNQYSKIYENIYCFKCKQNDKKPQKSKKSDYAIQKSSEHDASVISHVLSQKNCSARNIEEAKALFLTSGLSLFWFYKSIYKDFEKYPSVLMDETLTNILYLKNPNSNNKIQFLQVLKAHCNSTLINNDVWRSYISVLNDLIKNNTISIEDYSRLVSKNQLTQKFLLRKNSFNIEEKEILELIESLNNSEKENAEKINSLETEKKVATILYNKEEKEGKKLLDKISILELQIEKLHYKQAMQEYQYNQNSYSENNFKIFIKQLRKMLLKYVMFNVFSIVVFLFEDKIGTILSTNIKLPWLSPLPSIFLFLLPVIVSLIKKENILQAIKTFIPKEKKKLYLRKEKEFENEYQKMYPKPVIVNQNANQNN